MKLQMRTSNFKLQTLALGILHFAFCILQCQADLSVVVTPGYTFSSNERADTSKLNRLGQPTISIVGTIGGTNAGIGAATIDGTMLKDAFVDGTNITWNTAGPRQLKIVDGGVGVTQIGSAIAGFGLLGGSGTALRVNIDSNTITSGTDGDTLTLGTNLTPARLAWTTNTLLGGTPFYTNAAISLPTGWYVDTNKALVATVATKYTGTNINLSAAGVATFTHGLAAIPSVVQLALVCTNAENGYVAGDVVDAASFDISGSEQPFSVSWDATAVTVRANDGSTLQVIHKTSGNKVSVSARSNFILRLTAVVFP